MKQVVDAALKREATKLRDRHGKPLLSPDQHREFCEAIAEEMWWQEKPELDTETINYHPQSGWFDEGPSKGPPPCGRGLKPPEVLLLLVFFLFLLVADVVPNNGLV